MAWRAALWVGIYLALVVAPLVVLLIGPMPPGVGFWWDLSMAFGFSGIAMIGVQFALTARFKRASAPFGLDVIYLFHRHLAIIALLLILAHFAILWFGYQDALGTIDPREARWELTMGRVALVMFALAVVTSLWRKRLRLEYGLWRFSHVVLATLGFAAAVSHIVGVGTYTDAPGKRSLWLAITLFWILLVVWVRVAKPWTQLRRPYRIAEVRPERGKAWTLAIEPDGHPGVRRFMPGQFAWLTLRSSPFRLREHPFSISSAPETLPRLEFTIKELGDFTSTIGEMKPGEPAYLDGPYGVFSIDRHRRAPGFGFVVGGVGITPVMSMLHAMAERGDRRPAWLFYGSPTWEDAIFREELDRLSGALDLKLVHVLERPPEDWAGETGFLTQEILDRHLPKDERADLRYFLCGPPPMVEAAEAGLRAIGVPLDRLETEIFDLA